MRATFRLQFPKGYIADPYWPEREKVINIQKQSGINRARTPERRDKALRDYLATLEMTLETYRELEGLADRPFYRNGDEQIIMPTHQVYGCLVNAAANATAAVRIARADNLRSVIEAGEWQTGKIEADGMFERFAVVNSGSGKLSNQRALRSNPYIADFEAQGTVDFQEEYVQVAKLKDFLAFAGRDIGIGACRKLGWGRFNVIEMST